MNTTGLPGRPRRKIPPRTPSQGAMNCRVDRCLVAAPLVVHDIGVLDEGKAHQGRVGQVSALRRPKRNGPLRLISGMLGGVKSTIDRTISVSGDVSGRSAV